VRSKVSVPSLSASTLNELRAAPVAEANDAKKRKRSVITGEASTGPTLSGLGNSNTTFCIRSFFWVICSSIASQKSRVRTFARISIENPKGASTA
jgi:hypothetical protein